MLNCKQISEIVSRSLDEDLSFWTRMQLYMHVSMCGLCARLRKAMIRIDQEARRHGEDTAIHAKMSLATRQQIQQALDNSRPR